MLSNSNYWVITPDEKFKFEAQFRDLSPLNGYVSGPRAKDLFMKSNLPTNTLCKIWSLSDYDNDGQMTLNEFCIAMHLIKRKLEGIEVPDSLPPSLKNIANFNSNTTTTSTLPQPMSPYTGARISCSTMNTKPVTQQQNGFQTSAPTAIVNPISVVAPTAEVSDEWAIPQAVRPRYRLQFNQQDRNKRGYLTGVEAKAILVQSGLPNNTLAQIWSLADIDQDGNLTCDEFCVAMHLVEQARSGKQLPVTLPSCLLPAAYQRKSNSALNLSTSNGLQTAVKNKQEESQKPVILSGEDERRANYLKGQAELEKRRAILEEQMRQEEEARRQKERQEMERQEKIRQEKEAIRLAEIERQMELRRQQEAEREAALKRQAEERERLRRESEKSRLLEMEARRLEVAQTERRQEREQLSEMNSKKGNLIEAIANETERKRELQKRIESTSGTVESYKANIGTMRERRDELVTSTDSLRDELDIARAELNRCEREKREMEMQLIQQQAKLASITGPDMCIDPVAEQIKTVQALKASHQDKIKHLDKEIKELESSMGKRRDTMTSSKSKVKELEKKVTSRLVADIKRLQSSVSEKKNAAFAALMNKSDKNNPSGHQKESRSHSIDAEFMYQGQYNASIDRASAFKKIPNSGSIVKEQGGNEREYIYYEALYPFAGRQNDELSFKAGDSIIIDTQDQMEPNSGWLYGWLESGEGHGLFPEVYVKLVRREAYIQSSRSSIISSDMVGVPPPNNSSQYNAPIASGYSTTPHSYSHSNLSVSSGNQQFATVSSVSINQQSAVKTSHLCVALYPYEASVMGDLNLQPGNIVEILSFGEGKTDWWKGTNRDNQQQGLFPSNYVKVVPSEEAAQAESQSILTTGVPSNTTNNQDSNDMFASQMSQMSINSLASSTYSSISENTSTLQSQSANQNTADDLSAGGQVVSTPEIAEVKIDFTGTSSEQLSLKVGQLVHVRNKSPSGWWQGEIQNRGQQRRIGWFPGQYVTIISSSQSIQSQQLLQQQQTEQYDDSSLNGRECVTPTPDDNNMIQQPSTPTGTNPNSSNWYESTSTIATTTTSGPIELVDSLPGDYLITMYSYAAQNIDELTFDKGAILVLLDKNEPEWWLGRNISMIAAASNNPNNNQQFEGLFPVNYVRRLQQDNPADEEVMRTVMQKQTQGGNFPGGTVSGRPVSWYIDGTMTFNAILTEDEKRRQFYIRELIETEKVYYDDLLEVHQVFYEPIKRSNLLTPDELKYIFLNWSDLIPNSYSFYMALKIRKDMAGSQQPIQCIGDILLSNFPNFIVYVRFCSMQNQAIALLQKKQQQNPKFKELCQQCESNLRCQKMPMTSYFLKPMQRITKYKLLVENILKHTDDNHPDKFDTEEAVAAARSLCESVNEGVRERENSERLEWMQEHILWPSDQPLFTGPSGHGAPLLFNSNTNCLGHRRLLHSGTLYKARSNKELVGFLCNDFLLLCTPQYNTGGTPFVFPLETSGINHPKHGKMNFKVYRRPIILNQVMISMGNPTSGSNPQQHASHNNELFTVKEPNYEYVLKALSVNDRDKWVEKLMNASTFYINTENSKRERSMSIRRTAGIGRLLVTIVEANNLRFKPPSTSHSTNTASHSNSATPTPSKNESGSSSMQSSGSCNNLGGGTPTPISNNEKTIRKEVKSADAYCEASLGNQLQRTKVISGSLNPKWNQQMQFLIKDIDRDVLCLTVYNKDYFAPNDFLGRIEVNVCSVVNEKRTNRDPIEKRLKLMEVESGELSVKLDLALFKKP